MVAFCTAKKQTMTKRAGAIYDTIVVATGHRPPDGHGGGLRKPITVIG